jgi:hypothetical protein
MRFEDKVLCSKNEAQERLGGIGDTKYWSLVKDGRIKTRWFDGKRLPEVQSILELERDAPVANADEGMSEKVERATAAHQAKRARDKAAAKNAALDVKAERGRRKRARASYAAVA